MLDKIIASDYGLFRQDTQILQQRQAALHFKVDLLLEWNRPNEALAWLCLETEINPVNVLAQAMKERLKKQLHIEDFRWGLLPLIREGRIPPLRALSDGKVLPACGRSRWRSRNGHSHAIS